MASKNTKLRLLERDGYLCGIHSGGCRQKIDVDADDFDIDHIFPQTFIRDLPNVNEFRKPWNYQPMHRVCHERKGRGQINDAVQFDCMCHHNLIREDGRYVCYAERRGNEIKWDEVRYWEDVPYGHFVIKPGKSPNVPGRIVADDRYDVKPKSKGWERMGWSALPGYEHGHLFGFVRPYRRMLFNAVEFARCLRFSEAMAEVGEFEAQRQILGGESIIREVGTQYMLYLAAFYALRYCLVKFDEDGLMSFVDIASSRDKAMNIIAGWELRWGLGGRVPVDVVADVIVEFMPGTGWMNERPVAWSDVVEIEWTYAMQIGSLAMELIELEIERWFALGLLVKKQHWRRRD